MDDIKTEDELSSDLSTIIDSDSDMFNEDVSVSSEITEDAKWSDSNEDETTQRREYKAKNNIKWDVNPKKQHIQINKEKRRIKIETKILKINNKIKISKSSQTQYSVVVTTFNDIYIFHDLSFKKYKILNVSYCISDFDFVENKIVCVSDKCGYLKEIDLNNKESKDIKLGSQRNFFKILYDSNIYILGTTFEKRDGHNYELIKSFPEEAVDFCISQDRIAILRRDKTLSFYCKETNAFIEIRKYSDKYFFTKLFHIDDIFLTLMTDGIRVRRDGSQGETDYFKGEYKFIANNNENMFICGDNLNGLKVVRIKDLKNVTPGIVSKFMVKNVSGLVYMEGGLYIMHGSFISKMVFI